MSYQPTEVRMPGNPDVSDFLSTPTSKYFSISFVLYKLTTINGFKHVYLININLILLLFPAIYVNSRFFNVNNDVNETVATALFLYNKLICFERNNCSSK